MSASGRVEQVQPVRGSVRLTPGGHDLANSLTDLGTWFSRLGRPAEALPHTEEAVAVCRELAAADPGRYRPSLAESLTDLAEVLTGLGLILDAQAAQSEASELRQAAAKTPLESGGV